MKKIWKPAKYLLVLILGVGISRFVLFRDKVKTLPVNKVTPKQRVVKQTISSSGEVIADKEATLSFQITGKIKTILVKEGAYVEENAVLAQLTTSESYQLLQASKYALDVTKTDLELYIEDYATNLSAIGGEDEYYINLQKYQGLVSKADATYRSAQESFDENFLYAPFSGTVLDISMKEGETVTVGISIMKIATTDKLIFESALDQEDYGWVKEDQDVEIELDSYESETFVGKVISLPTYANGGTTPSFTVKMEITGDSDKVLLGMTGDAKIIVNATDGEVTAVLYDEIFYNENNEPYLWVINDDERLKIQPVEIGLEGDLYTELKSEVTDTIVSPLSDSLKLKEGYKAKISNE